MTQNLAGSFYRGGFGGFNANIVRPGLVAFFLLLWVPSPVLAGYPITVNNNGTMKLFIRAGAQGSQGANELTPAQGEKTQLLLSGL
ncbi:MAG: hypothetical protein ABSE08_00355 [Syntrophobacteraceae bacterium]|jgi:hypothetical protein